MIFSIYLVMITFNLLEITSIETASSTNSNKFRFPERIIGSETSAGDEVLDFAKKYDYVDMGVDFLDDYTPTNLRMALANATLSDDPMTNQFTPSHNGLFRLQSVIAKMYSPLIGQNLSADENIVITVGASEALFSTFLGHTSLGDEWIVTEPAYSTYLPMIKMCNGIARVTSLKRLNYRLGTFSGDDWMLDKEELASLFNERTKGILLNNPLNPLGKVYTLEELQFIAELATKYNVLVISDEAQEWLTYKPHIRIASLPGMFERTITIGSATKTFSLSGWRIGWAYGSKDIMSNVEAVHRTVVYWTATLTATPQQVAIAYAFEEEIRNFGLPTSYFVSHRDHIERNRDLMVQAFRDSGMRLTIPDGGCCMLVDWSPLKSQLYNVQGATDFAKWLVANVVVLGLPGVSYYSEGHQYMGEDYVRFCFNKKYDNLKKAAQSLRNSNKFSNNKSCRSVISKIFFYRIPMTCDIIIQRKKRRLIKRDNLQAGKKY